VDDPIEDLCAKLVFEFSFSIQSGLKRCGEIARKYGKCKECREMAKEILEVIELEP